jgi:hypothetical protein
MSISFISGCLKCLAASRALITHEICDNSSTELSNNFLQWYLAIMNAVKVIIDRMAKFMQKNNEFGRSKLYYF